MKRRHFLQAARLLVAPVGVLLIALTVPLVFLTTRLRHFRGKPPRILWGPTPLINYVYWSEAARNYGYTSRFAAYAVEYNYSHESLDFLLTDKFRYSRALLLLPYLGFTWAIWNFDIFHFCFNLEGYLYRTPLRYAEYWLLRLLGKKIVVAPYGSDVQLPSMVIDKYKYSVGPYVQTNEKAVWRNIQQTLSQSDFVMAGGASVEYLPVFDLSFPFVAIGLDAWPISEVPKNDVPVIVHSTNHRNLKGTNALVRVCDELQEDGHEFELRVVEQTRNTDARAIYESADIVADQFIVGAYGMFGLEAMALGKPVIGYLRENLFEFNLPWSECPITNSSLDDLKENLRLLLGNAELRVQLGRQCRAYVEKYHSYEYIGAILDKIYRTVWYDEDPDWSGFAVRVGDGRNPLFDKGWTPGA